VADATLIENSPIPLLCWSKPEFASVLSKGGASDWAQPCSNPPFEVEVLKELCVGSSKSKQFVHLYTRVQLVAFTFEYIG